MVSEFEKAYAEARRLTALKVEEMERVADEIAARLTEELDLPEGTQVVFDKRPLVVEEE